MKVNKKEIIRILSLTPQGSKGWFTGKCPFCGRENKFGVIFDGDYKGKRLNSYNCFSGKCGKKGSLYSLLSFLDRLDLVETINFTKINETLENKLIIETEDQFETPKSIPPLGFKRIYENKYLEGRGFSEEFTRTPIGITSIEPDLSNGYVVFLIMEDDECKGWIARSEKDKKNIEDINKRRKERGITREYLRWQNSGDDFQKLIYGLDEFIKGVTHTGILVESITSRVNVVNLLGLNYQDEIKCGATFGKKLHRYQIKKLQDKGVKNVIMLWDSDAINESKQYAMELNKYFNVKVGFLSGEKDPGDLNNNELSKVFENLQNPINFINTKVQKKILK